MRYKKVKAVVEVHNERGMWLLMEIRGLKEGTVIEGRYNEKAKSIDFSWNGQDAVLWEGVNATILEMEQESAGPTESPYDVSLRWNGHEILVWAALCELGKDDEIIAEADSVKELREYAAYNYIPDSNIWWYAAEIINSKGETNPPVKDRSRRRAVALLKKSLK